MRILLTGGWGWVGSHLCPHLKDMGHTLVSLDLREGDDMLNPSTVARKLEGCEAVINLAGRGGPAAGVSYAEFMKVNVEALAVLLEVMSNSPAKRLIAPESIGYYGYNATKGLAPQSLPITTRTLPTHSGVGPYDLSKQLRHVVYQAFADRLQIVSFRMGPVRENLFLESPDGSPIYGGFHEKGFWAHTSPKLLQYCFEKALRVPEFPEGHGYKLYMLVSPPDPKIPVAQWLAEKYPELKMPASGLLFDMTETAEVFDLPKEYRGADSVSSVSKLQPAKKLSPDPRSSRQMRSRS